MRIVGATAALAALILVPGVSAAAPGTPSAPVKSPLTWGACPAFDPPTVSKPECATLEVPLDYSHPDGAKIQLAISRLASPHPDKRRGILLTNSGGPGGEGLRFPADIADGGGTKLAMPQSVRDSYDIIGIDPRGVGHSTPVTCDLTPAQQTSNIPPYARNAADVAQQAKVSRQVAKQCGASKTAALLPHITTANTARDLDQVRAALGEAKASYLGISYGTYLGAVYTTLFPRTTDRVLLDSSASPGGWDYDFQRRIARGFSDRFPDFAKYAAAHPEYGLGSTPAQVTKKYYAMAAALDKTTTSGSPDGALFRQATLSQLYYDKNFPALAELWKSINAGTVPATRAAAAASDNYLASQLHVICNDSRWPRSVLTYQLGVAVDRIRYPMFGAASANISACAFWPRQSEPQVRITDHGPSNVLIVQNQRDPITPLAGARLMRYALGDRARLVTADQGGHLSYLFKSNQCLNDTATNFLATGNRPHHDLNCQA
ncbi:alpha/beta hydrolase [Kribbella sp. DT2]|uniref:alpha/beta hydrolase n=1 Tax=Kribbella sp. DT2 TaxID=3393427 RepID=UPI003CF62880